MSNATDYISKHNKRSGNNLKYDFMPSMLEIIEKPAHVGGKIIIFGILSLLIVTIIWACYSKLDVVVTGQGSVKPIGEETIIQTAYSGVVSKVNVKEGDFVKKGDVLFNFDPDNVEIEEVSAKANKEIIVKQLEMYRKILSGKNLTKTSLNTYKEDFKPYAMTIINEQKSHNHSVNKLKLDIESSETQYQIEKLNNNKYSDQLTQEDKEIQKLKLNKIRLQINKEKEQLDSMESQFVQGISAKVSELSQKLIVLDAQLEQALLAKDSKIISAPSDGYIKELAFNKAGAVVSQTQVLCSLVDGDTPEEMECFVQNRDISNIKVGDKCEIKLDSYPYSDYGTVLGEVIYISKDSIINEQLGNVYSVRVKINNNNNEINIIPGLAGSIEIKTGKRTVMEYFLDPMINGLDKSFKEK